MKSFRPLKALAVVILGMFLFFTSVGTSLAATLKPNAGEKSEYYAPKDTGAINDYEGGMNNFSDRDARAPGSIEEQAAALKRQAEENIKKSSSDLGRNARRVARDSDKLGENVKEKAGSVTEKLQDEAESFGKSTKKGLRNIKNNAQDAPGYAADQADKTIGNPIEGIKQAGKDETETVKRSVKEAK
ncbi:hypothetical protein NIES4071_71220 [Calothrix sp. NIES-4071]|nr:hypothetical protein NIES4071_71220 [Calothrix sp. NIES-4071]BAZ61397.1 hypothetical protein NIES4105_71170 [Calothrix sp. NIES-4105]